MHDDVGFGGFGGEERGAVVVAVDDGDVGVRRGEGFGNAAEEDRDAVVWVGRCDGVEDGAADVACAAGTGGC